MQSCSQGALVFPLLSFWFKVGRLEVGGEVFFQAVFGVESGLSRVHLDTGLSMQVLFGTAVGGGGRGGFIFLSGNRRAEGALLLFLLS